MSYYQTFDYSYCIPDNIDLPIMGTTKDKIRKSFQVSLSSIQNTS